MKEVGLLQPLIVNRRTGYLLGGHQRLSQLDSLEKYDAKTHANDYELDVAVVDVDEKAEMEMLVFLNNPTGQGSWDLEKLADMALTGGSSFEGMGFERVDIEMLFEGDNRFESLFPESVATKQTKDALREIKEDGREAQKAKDNSETADGKPTGLDAFRAKGASRDISAEFYLVVVCKDASEKAELMEHLRIPKGEQYIAPGAILGLKRG